MSSIVHARTKWVGHQVNNKSKNESAGLAISTHPELAIEKFYVLRKHDPMQFTKFQVQNWLHIIM